ncbi:MULTISPECIES: hypothetical protein [Segatella]|nr:hypothetical protein [Prevotella sp.]
MLKLSTKLLSDEKTYSSSCSCGYSIIWYNHVYFMF